MANSNAEDLLPKDQILEEEEHIREPKPWHKPRKQWVRTEQWSPVIKNLLCDLTLTDRPFKYLTLPGEEMLDIRVLYHNLFEQNEIQLKFLGFDSKRKTDVNISYDEVFRLPFIHKSSHIYQDSIEKIFQQKSLASENAREYNGFDAINLDFCDSIGGRDAGTPNTHLETLKTIINFQTAGRTEPWVLFITTRCDSDSVKSSVWNKLVRLVLDNAKQHKEFSRRIRAEPFNLEPQKIKEKPDRSPSLDANKHMYIFAVGFSKWLIKLAMNAWSIKQEVTAAYRIADSTDTPDMLSLAFRFEHIQHNTVDHTGLVQSFPNGHTPKEPHELSLIHTALDQFKNMTDVDWLLYEKPELRERVIQQTAKFMSEARYDYNVVLKWSKDNIWKPPSRN